MMLMVVLCFLVHAHANNPPALPERVGQVSLPQGPAKERNQISAGPALPQNLVNEHDRLDDTSRLVLGYTIGELQSMTTTDRDRVFTEFNVVQEQYMRTMDWVEYEINKIRHWDSYYEKWIDDYLNYMPHIKAYYEMVLQWLEDVVRREKNRKEVIKEMTRQWKKLDDKPHEIMTYRFMGFQSISDMAKVKWE